MFTNKMLLIQFDKQSNPGSQLFYGWTRQPDI